MIQQNSNQSISLAERTVKVTIFKLADSYNHKIVIVAGLKRYLTDISKISFLELVLKGLTRIEAWNKCPEIWLILLRKFIVFRMNVVITNVSKEPLTLFSLFNHRDGQ